MNTLSEPNGHAKLQALLSALDASSITLRRDLHRGEGLKGDYAIRGKFGHIYADGVGFLLVRRSEG